MKELSEKEIIRKIQQGEINYFEYFVKKYSRIIFSFVFNKIRNEQDTNDIVQNAFIKMYKALDKFNPDLSFYPYLFTITKNELVNYYRKKELYLPLNENIIQNNTLAIDDGTFLGDLIKNLKKDYQKVIQLLAEGYSYKEISQKLNKPINTVKTWIRRAKKQIKYYEKG